MIINFFNVLRNLFHYFIVAQLKLLGVLAVYILFAVSLQILMALFMGTFGGSILIISHLVDIVCLSEDIKGNDMI